MKGLSWKLGLGYQEGMGNKHISFQLVELVTAAV